MVAVEEGIVEDSTTVETVIPVTVVEIEVVVENEVDSETVTDEALEITSVAVVVARAAMLEEGDGLVAEMER